MSSTDRREFNRALQCASRRAAKSGEHAYVVNADGDGYAVADEFELDTFWLGATVLAEIQPDGTVAAE